MGPTVRVLPDNLVDQIAAGEVIERPANLVKELLENALDAGATAITVSVEDGGRGQVRVTDDGIGMSPEDAALCVRRHATSKIRSFEDLVSVSTLGFRGEALPSIGSVSRMTITTRPKADLLGTRVRVEGGELREVSPAGCPPGTTVDVEDLFYNVPARKKFLRARQTESSRIFEVCQRVALTHPGLRLQVRSEGRQARSYLPVTSLAERAAQVFGDLPLQKIHVERDGVTLDAALAPPELARAGARHLVLLVNGRPIRDRPLARAVAFAYGDRLKPGHYPRGVVSLRLPPEDVDVNAHPQKTEVRFRRSAQLVDLVTRMLAARLPSAAAGDAYWAARIGGSGPSERQTAIGAAKDGGRIALTIAEPQREYEPGAANGLRYLLQLQNHAILCVMGDEVLVLDRERADALVRYDALRDALAVRRVGRQTLLFPDRVELEPFEASIVERHEAMLAELGFEWSRLGDQTYVVRSVPALLGEARAATTFRYVIRALSSDPDDPLDSALHALAEAGARKNGEPLDEPRVRRIVAGIWPSRHEHRACILGRVRAPAPDAEIRDE